MGPPFLQPSYMQMATPMGGALAVTPHGQYVEPPQACLVPISISRPPPSLGIASLNVFS